jgi:hypothetical protein
VKALAWHRAERGLGGIRLVLKVVEGETQAPTLTPSRLAVYQGAVVELPTERRPGLRASQGNPQPHAETGEVR